MNFKLALSAVSLGIVALAGCAADSSDSSTSTDSDLVAPMPPVKVEGAWRAKPGTATAASSFEGIVFKSDGTFFADMDTGIRCITTPCPSTVRLEGTFTVRGRSLILTAKDQTQSGNGYYDRYSVTRTGDSLKVERLGSESFGNELALESSYCSAPTDCAGQGLLAPACAPGGWTCSAQNTCGFACGIVPVTNPLWPSDRTQLVAETKGGGFTPPPPAGSECAVGAAKYTLDVASKKLSWEVCKLVDWSTPMKLSKGSKSLNNVDIASIDGAMNHVAVSSREICGADKPFLSISVTSASKGTTEYADSFYSCNGGDDTYVDNIDGVFRAFRDVAGL